MIEARRARLAQVLDGVSLNELEGEVRLRYQVNPDDFPTGPRIPHRCSASAAEQIEETGFHTAPSIDSIPEPVSVVTTTDLRCIR
jgi:hypothetical protein